MTGEGRDEEKVDQTLFTFEALGKNLFCNIYGLLKAH